jgi:hypothetical protein
MLTERLQILISPEQKRRLETEAHTRGESVGGLVREAIDERYGGRRFTFSRAERMAAVERMRKAPPATRFLSPEDLTKLHGEEIEEEYPELSKLFPPHTAER